MSQPPTTARLPASGPIDDADDGVIRQQPEPPIDRAALDRSLVHGIAWTGSVKWLAQVVAWATTLVVARVLSPSDYGLVGVAAVYFGLLTLLSEAGLGMTVIALRELKSDQLAELHTIATLMGITGIAVSAAIADPLAAFFDAPALAPVIIVMSANFVIVSLRTVPQALLQRELDFRRVAIIDGANSVVTAAVSVTLALMGFRYWALVVSTIVGGAVAAAMALIWHPLGFRRPRITQLRGTLRVSRDILIGSVAWYISQSADFFVAGKMLGTAALGAYTVAWNLAYSIVEKVIALVNGVTSSIFSAAKHDRALLTRYITRITGTLALVLLPASAGVALVSRELVLAILGEKWRAVIVPLTLLVLYAGVRSLTPILTQALTITGDQRYTMQRNIAGAICLPIGFIVGARWGIVGIATTWMLVHAPVVLVPQLRRVSSHLGIGMRDYAPAVAPAFVSTLIMTAAVLLAGLAIPSAWPVAVVLGVKIVVGAFAYAAAVWLFFRDQVRSLVRAIAQVRQQVPIAHAPSVPGGAGGTAAEHQPRA